MEVLGVRVDASPAGGDRARLRAEVRYERGGAEEYWFDVPGAVASDLSCTGNPWLACLLPLAATLGEPLRIPLAVDPVLLANASRLTRIWRTWYPHLFDVALDVEAETGTSSGLVPARVGAFFSGGVDSFFTALRERDYAAPGERAKIQDLISVWGFDIPLEQPRAFARLCARNSEVASSLGLRLVDVATNLRATRWSEAQWSYLAHGAALASTALALERRVATVYIPGSGSHSRPRPWGSHWVTDPLFSTQTTTIVHDGMAWLRTEKLEFLAGRAVALGALRVCYETYTDENCGSCTKCLRTMLALELFGALGRCGTFPRSADLLASVARMDCSAYADRRESLDLRRVAESLGRRDVVRALDRSLRRTRVRQAMHECRRAMGTPARRFLAALRGAAG